MKERAIYRTVEILVKHYPSDSKTGESLGDKMYQFIKSKI